MDEKYLMVILTVLAKAIEDKDTEIYLLKYRLEEAEAKLKEKEKGNE